MNMKERYRWLTPFCRTSGERSIFSAPFQRSSVLRTIPWCGAALEEPGRGRVLVVDGGASNRCALVGDMLAEMGMENGWAGLIIFGCIRDSAVVSSLDIGIKALGTNPRRSVKKGIGDRDIPISFGDATFNPGEYAYSDTDGVLISALKLI